MLPFTLPLQVRLQLQLQFLRGFKRQAYPRHATRKPLPKAKAKSSSSSSSYGSASAAASASDSSDAYPPYKFGPYASLNLPDEKAREGVRRLVSQITDFSELKILPEIRAALIAEIKQNTVLRDQNYMSSTKKVKSVGELNGLIIRPTPIQTGAIKIINDKRKPEDFFKAFTLAAETGSGKTWAYLAPLLQQLVEGRQSEATKDVDITAEGKVVPVTSASVAPTIKHRAGIKSIILVPTHELVDQVYSTLQFTAEALNMSVLKWDTDSNFKTFIAAFRQGIDIMVTTPGKLNALSHYDSVANMRQLFGSTSFCVVDEADTLMDPSFIEDTSSLLKYMSNLSTLVFASATIPSKLTKALQLMYPKQLTHISTPSLHKLPKSIEFRTINAAVSPYKGSKMKALAQALYAIHCDGTERGYTKRVIVFVNKKDDVPRVSERLAKEFGHDVTYISSMDTPDERREKVAPFVSPPAPLADPTRPMLKVLVCTDLLSRGLNFHSIRNVVLLDVPGSSADLVHRAGRTGRMNQSGRVFLIISDSDRSHVKGLPKVLRNNRRLG
jgi:ATP-dependent RNA helicase MRH4